MTLDRLGEFASATLSAALVAALAATTVATMIAPQSAHAEAGTPDIGLYVKGGTLGIGIGVGVSITDTVSARLGYSTYKSSKVVSKTNVDYSGDLTLGGGEAMVDWHPLASGFRISGGLYFNRNKLTVHGQPSGGTFTFNGHTYTAAEIGTVNGDVKYKSVAPYLGLGWGDAAEKSAGFSFFGDAGVMFQGNPDATLHTQCGAGVPALQCAQITADVAVEESDLNDKVSNTKFWPVLSVGVAYRF